VFGFVRSIIGIILEKDRKLKEVNGVFRNEYEYDIGLLRRIG